MVLKRNTSRDVPDLGWAHIASAQCEAGASTNLIVRRVTSTMRPPGEEVGRGPAMPGTYSPNDAPISEDNI